MNSGEWQHSPDIPKFTEVELPENNSVALPEKFWDYVQAQRDIFTDITFNNEFFLSCGVALEDNIVLAGTYSAENYRMPGMPALAGSSPHGRPTYLVWLNRNLKAEKQIELPERYYNVSHMLYDALSDQIYMLCSVDHNNRALSFMVVAMKSDGTVLWEMPVPYNVMDFVLIPSESDAFIAMAVNSVPKAVHHGDRTYWGNSMRRMRDIHSPDGGIYASAVFVFDSTGALQESYYEKEGIYQQIVGDSKQLLCGIAWYEEIAWQELNSEKLAEAPHVGYQLISRQTGEIGERQELEGNYRRISAVALTEDMFYLAAPYGNGWSEKHADIYVFSRDEELQDIFEGTYVRFYQSSKWPGKIIAYDFDADSMDIEKDVNQFGYIVGTDRYVTAQLESSRSITAYSIYVAKVFIDFFDQPACLVNMTSIRDNQANLLCIAIQ